MMQGETELHKWNQKKLAILPKASLKSLVIMQTMFRIFKKNTNSLSDQELLEQYKASGNLDLLGQLYERYMELVYGLCLKYFKDPQKAEDAVMEIFEQLIEKVRVHEIRQFKSWLHVLARNHCLMALRKKNREISQDFESDFMYSEPTEHHNVELEEDTQEADLKNCIEQLAEKQKNCITLFYLEDKSYKEIATTTGEAIGKVRSYIQNGRRNLKNCMEKKKEP